MGKKQSDTNEQADTPFIPLMNQTEWDQSKVTEYGGSASILIIHEGQIAGPLIYGGHHPITTDLGQTTVHVASDDKGDSWRLPIQATFLRAVDQSQMQPGDRFAVRRMSDVIKKKGKGAGNPMAIYSIKVLERKGNAPATPF